MRREIEDLIVKTDSKIVLIVLDGLGLITITLGIDASVVILGRLVDKFGPTVDAGQTFGARLGMVTIG